MAENGTWSVTPEDDWNSSQGMHEPQYQECKRCRGLGEDEDGAACIPCMGLGEYEIKPGS